MVRVPLKQVVINMGKSEIKGESTENKSQGRIGF